jgi:hypothetical protein
VTPSGHVTQFLSCDCRLQVGLGSNFLHHSPHPHGQGGGDSFSSSAGLRALPFTMSNIDARTKSAVCYAQMHLQTFRSVGCICFASGSCCCVWHSSAAGNSHPWLYPMQQKVCMGLASAGSTHQH